MVFWCFVSPFRCFGVSLFSNVQILEGQTESIMAFLIVADC